MATEAILGALDDLSFTNRFTHDLPADPISAESDASRHPRQVPGAAFSRVLPTPVSNPTLIAVSSEVAEMLNLTGEVLKSQAFVDMVSGNLILEGMDPFAANYAGHQFGNWAGQLGDGRAIALGEITTHDGEHQTVQLKGAGPTPYSRRADGRAVLRSSLREFLCSEAMFHLGVPTTRALSLTLTGDDVVRDMFYDGNASPEPGAICTRVAPSFVRFGNFELFASRDEIDLLRKLTDHTIAADFAHLIEQYPIDAERYVAFFSEVLDRTALLAAHWMRVGFVHGVLNTDNMSILGLTIDYGPYGWLEDYDPGWTPNTTDNAQRRYRYGQQPAVAHWNLAQLANALVPLIGEVAPLQEAIQSFQKVFLSHWLPMLAAKLGLGSFDSSLGDEKLAEELLALLGEVETDMTLFFRGLANFAPEASTPRDAETPMPDWLNKAFYAVGGLTPSLSSERTQELAERWNLWFDRYQQRLTLGVEASVSQEERSTAMNAVNPLYVLRNYLAQEAIDRVEQGDLSAVDEILDVLRYPYSVQPGMEQYANKRPEWARTRPGCSALSCSS